MKTINRIPAAVLLSVLFMAGPLSASASAEMSLTTFETTDFSGSGICAFCHSGLRDQAGNDVSIDSDWRATMMANSARDPFWQAKINSEAERHPALKAAIEEKCSRCHMGMARYQAVTDGAAVAVLGQEFLYPSNPLHEAAMDGVSCTLCHQIQSAGLGTPASYTGLYFIDTYSSPPDRAAFGPYSGPLKNPMEMRTGFSPDAGYHLTDADFCGTCHTLYTPVVDGAGNMLGEFPEQTTFLEWRHSRSLTTCADCHMPDASGSVAISNRPRMLQPRRPFGRHWFTGGNYFMLTLLRNHISDLGITAAPAHLDTAIGRTNALLKSAAALRVDSVSLNQGILCVTLEVRNLTGHKLPTGFPARRAWLHLAISDKTGRIVYESGKPQPDGSIAGNEGDLAPGRFEPHYDLITGPGQVQIYESVMADTDRSATYTLLQAAAYAKDNRLLPAGFDKSAASADIAVYGAAAGDQNFAAGRDLVTYRIDVSGGLAPFSISAEFLYQPLSYAFVRDLRGDQGSLTQDFLRFFDGENGAPPVLSEVQTSIPQRR